MIETSRVFAQSRNLTDESSVCFGWIAANVIVSSVNDALPANGGTKPPQRGADFAFFAKSVTRESGRL